MERKGGKYDFETGTKYCRLDWLMNQIPQGGVGGFEMAEECSPGSDLNKAIVVKLLFPSFLPIVPIPFVDPYHGCGCLLTSQWGLPDDWVEIPGIDHKKMKEEKRVQGEVKSRREGVAYPPVNRAVEIQPS